MKSKMALAVTVLMVAVFSACSGGGDEEARASAEARCLPVPSVWGEHLEAGLTAEGRISILKLKMVESNDDLPWVFIGGMVTAPGMEEIMVWGASTTTLPTQEPLFVAADTLAAEFSVWDFPGRGSERFDSKFYDEIEAVSLCISAS